MRRLVTLGALVAIACGPDAATPPARGPRIAESRLDEPFVVFTTPMLLLDRVGIPSPAPVTVGSSPSRDTLVTDAPDLVSVDADGNLVAHRAGHARIRAPRTGSVLEVEVRPVEPIHLAPATLVLSPGARAELEVLGSGGRLLPERVVWGTDAPAIVTVRDGVVEARGAAGRARIRARHGDQAAIAVVEVRGVADDFAIVPRDARITIGGLAVLSAVSGGRTVEARWRLATRGVLADLSGGVFDARAPGKARVCASFAGQERCTFVEVVR